MPTIGDLTIAASTGDVLLVQLSGVVGTGTCHFDVQFPNGSNYLGNGVGAGSQGCAPFAHRISGGIAAPFGGTVPYTVAAGDISGGNVALRVRYKTNNSGATTVFASSTVGPLFFGVVNLGQ